MRTLREAGAGGVEPPLTVLETAVLPVTPCSRNAERRIRTSNDHSGPLFYSQVQCQFCQLSKFVRQFDCQKTKERARSALNARKRPAPLSLIELVFEISGAGVRSRWIKTDIANNRRTGVLPISWYLWYSRISAYRRLKMACSGSRAQRTHVIATPQCASSI